MNERCDPMTVAVNLMPSEVRMGQAYRRKLRTWTLITSWTVLTAAVPVAVEWVNQGRLRQLHSENARLMNEHSATRGTLNQVVAQRQTFGRQMACADALRSKRAWSGIMTLLQRSIPEAVWLQSMTSHDAVAAVAPGAKAALPNATVKPTASSPQEATVYLEGPRKLELEGYALEHDQLYQFMSSLRDWQSFEKVELTRAGKEPTGETTAVRFKVECLW